MRPNLDATVRNVVGPLVARALKVEVRGAHNVPPRGPLIVIALTSDETTRWVLRSLLPRPVHIVRALEGAAIDAQFEAVERLVAGEAIAFAGAHPPPGFVVLASDAPIVPAEIAMDPVSGQRTLFLGVPIDVPESWSSADPASLARTRAASEWVRQHVSDFAQEVRRRVPA